MTYRRPINDPILRLAYGGECDDEVMLFHVERERVDLRPVKPKSHRKERKLHRLESSHKPITPTNKP
jgi:hypothetical protein